MEDNDNNNNNQNDQNLNDLTIEDGPETEPTDITDAWAEAAGYTPLNDLNTGMGNPYIMVSTGPSDSSDSCDENENARHGNDNFHVNQNVFDSSIVQDADFDFGDIAASALSALDEEYQQTIVHHVQPNTNAESSNEHENKQKQQEDEDLKIIAAGFDDRKEELKRIREQGGFHVQWDEDTSTQEKSAIISSCENDQEQEQTQTKKIDNDVHAHAHVHVDTNAVRKAIKTLSVKNKDARFQQKFAAWQHNQLLKKEQDSTKDPHLHTLIPVASYKMFDETKTTATSRQASENLSRSATLAEAVVRLSLLPSFQDETETERLLIDIVGVDHVECESASTIRNTFQPFARWLGDYCLAFHGNKTIRVHFRLIGRELFTDTTTTTNNKVVVDILDSSTKSSSYLQATATCHSGVYHEFLEETRRTNTEDDLLGEKTVPDLAVAFNAGIWGYREWADTIQYLALQQFSSRTIPTQNGARCGLPMIITAYTLDECQEDQEVISESINETGGGSEPKRETTGSYRAEILWESERNTFGSQVVRETKGSTQEYRENACWQAWLLGGKI